MAITTTTFDADQGIQYVKAKTEKEQQPVQKTWTPEELEDMKNVTLKSFGWVDEDPKPEAESVTTDKKEDVEAVPAEEAPKPEPVKKASKKQLEQEMEDRIARRVMEENEKLLARIQPKAPEVPAAPVQPDSNQTPDEDVTHQLAVFEEMSKLPGADRNIHDKFKKFFNLQAKYQEEWQKENPNLEYDSEATEHADWYSENQPDYDDRKFNIAQTAVITKRIMAEHAAKTSLRTALVRADANVEVCAEDMSNFISEQLKADFGDSSSLTSDGPVKEKYQSVIGELSNKIRATAVLTTYGSGVAFNESDPVHASVRDDIMKFDSDISGLSGAEQKQLLTLTLGPKSKLLAKTFVSAKTYQTLSESEFGKHWTICAEPELASKLMMIQAKDSMHDWISSLSKQLGIKNGNGSASKATPTAQSSTPTRSNSQGVKPTPPELSPSAASVTSQSGSQSKGGNSWEDIARSF